MSGDVAAVIDPLGDRLRSTRLLAIVRGTQGDRLRQVLETLIDAGIGLLEVTLTTPGSLSAVEQVSSEHGPGVLVGIGSVRTVFDVTRAADAGAQFVVSPHLDRDIVGQAEQLGLGALPGVFTPSEALAALRAGARAVKLFPASALGPTFITALQQPLPDLAIVPTGGIGLADVPGWLDAGALAVAVGSPMLGDALSGGNLSALRSRALAFLTAAAGQGDD